MIIATIYWVFPKCQALSALHIYIHTPPQYLRSLRQKYKWRSTYQVSKYANINQANNLLNVFISYLDKYTFIMTWKARFKFKILRPLSMSCWNMAAQEQMGHGAPFFLPTLPNSSPHPEGPQVHGYGPLNPRSTSTSALCSSLKPENAHTFDAICPGENWRWHPS